MGAGMMRAERNGTKFDPLSYLIAAGVDDQIADDWLMLRKQRRAPATKTAIERIATQAKEAGWSLNEALGECCENGWQGFKAEWVKKRAVEQQKAQAASLWYMSSSGIEEKARELGVAQCVGEHFIQFRERVYACAGVTAEMVRRARIDAGERI